MTFNTTKVSKTGSWKTKPNTILDYDVEINDLPEKDRNDVTDQFTYSVAGLIKVFCQVLLKLIIYKLWAKNILFDHINPGI